MSPIGSASLVDPVVEIFWPKDVAIAASSMDRILNFPLRSEVDRFGFSSVLNYILCSRYSPKRAYCNWVHGWKWYRATDPKMLGITDKAIHNYFSRQKPIVVHNCDQQNFLIEAGFTNVINGCLPYAYLSAFSMHVTNIIDTRNRSVLVMLPKSQYYAPKRNSFDEMISYVNSDHGLRDKAVFCVFADDIKRPAVMKILSSQHVPFIIGASPFDILAMLRIRKVISSFGIVLTNTIGTHIPLAASYGVQVKIVSEIYDERPLSFIRDCWPSNGLVLPPNEYFEYLEFAHSIRFLRMNLGFLLDDGFWLGPFRDWGAKEINGNQILSGQRLKDVLGWSASCFVTSNTLSLLSRIT